MGKNDNAVEKAIAYFEDAIKKNDEYIEKGSASLTASLKELLTEQSGHFATALNALRDVAEKEDRNEGRKR